MKTLAHKLPTIQLNPHQVQCWESYSQNVEFHYSITVCVEQCITLLLHYYAIFNER